MTEQTEVGAAAPNLLEAVRQSALNLSGEDAVDQMAEIAA